MTVRFFLTFSPFFHYTARMTYFLEEALNAYLDYLVPLSHLRGTG